MAFHILSVAQHITMISKASTKVLKMLTIGSNKAPFHVFEFFDTSTPMRGQDETDFGEAGCDRQQKSHRYPSNDIILLMVGIYCAVLELYSDPM